MLLAACQTATEAPAVVAPVTTEAPVGEEPAVAENPGLKLDAAKVAAQFFDEAEYQKSIELMTKAPLNPDAPIYLQYLEENPTTIADYPQYAAFAEKKHPYNICFSKP